MPRKAKKTKTAQTKPPDQAAAPDRAKEPTMTNAEIDAHPLILVSTKAAITYCFCGEPGSFGWANCTVNDATGELTIQSDWGNWSHRWGSDPGNLGAPNLTAFIGGRDDVDYLARKLQREGHAGQRWSAKLTARALRRHLCERRLEHGREQIEGRLEPEDMPRGRPLPHLLYRYTDDGLPVFSDQGTGSHGARLPYLTRDTTRRIWVAIGDCADELRGSNGDLFYERVSQIDGFTDYVTEQPWEFGETEQTPEDRALREIVLPALIMACRDRINDLSVPGSSM